MKQYNSPLASIPGISSISAATLIGEFKDIYRFDNPNQMLAYAGLEPSSNQSGTTDYQGHMVKHGSGHLRYVLFNIVPMIYLHNPTFYSYYHKKKFDEGKALRVAQSHVIKNYSVLSFILRKQIRFLIQI